jgi:hypothetical protein
LLGIYPVVNKSLEILQDGKDDDTDGSESLLTINNVKGFIVV